MKHDEVVPAALAGQRLDRVVAMMTAGSRSQASAWILEGEVRVDGEVACERSRRLTTGERIEVDVPEVLEERPFGEPAVAFEVVHVDAQVIVVNKPAGLVVHPGAGHPDGTLVNGLVARFPEIGSVGDPARPGIVHRLDQGTSGLMVVARTSESYTTLVSALAARSVHRAYRALVHGHPEAARGAVDAPIGRSPRDPTKMAVVSGGKEARTRYRVLESFAQPMTSALIECELETGRTHQIRVHLAAIGHAVVGDTRYGGSRRGLPLERPFLHACALRFDHPATKEPMHFDADLPEDLEAVLATFVP